MMKKWLLKNIPIKARVQKLYPIYDQNQLNLIPYLWPKRLENHTLWGRTYLYSPYKEVPPPPPARVPKHLIEAQGKHLLRVWIFSTGNTMTCDLCFVPAGFRSYSSQLPKMKHHNMIREHFENPYEDLLRKSQGNYKTCRFPVVGANFNYDNLSLGLYLWRLNKSVESTFLQSFQLEELLLVS